MKTSKFAFQINSPLVHIVFSGFVAKLKIRSFCESGVIWFVMADPTCLQLLILVVTILSFCSHFINHFTPLCSGLESKFRSFYERLVQNDYKITRRPLLHTNAWTFYLFSPKRLMIFRMFLLFIILSTNFTVIINISK
jgi:hypothetical protein